MGAQPTWLGLADRRVVGFGGIVRRSGPSCRPGGVWGSGVRKLLGDGAQSEDRGRECQYARSHGVAGTKSLGAYVIEMQCDMVTMQRMGRRVHVQ